MHAFRPPLAWLFLTLLALAAGTGSVRAAVLVDTNAVWRLYKGTNEPSGTDRSRWRQPSFDDQSWSQRVAPFSYGDNLTVGTLLTDMGGRYGTFYLRKSFTVPDPASHQRLRLRAAIDDGFIAYLNGQEIARVNAAPGDRPFNDPQSPDRITVSVAEPIGYVEYALPATAPLVAGVNVLAVHVLNSSISSSDIFFDTQLTSVVEEQIPPTIAGIVPSPGEVTNLSRVTVTFSEAVTGVDEGDLVLNGFTSRSLKVVGAATYEFTFDPPAYGPVSVGWAPDHSIRDTAVVPNAFLPEALGNTWQYRYIDPAAPFLAARLPEAGSVVRQLSQVELHFTEPVTGVDAHDLRVNGLPATSVVGVSSGPYLFSFPPAAEGLTTFSFDPAHGIRDVGAFPLAFAGATWSVTVRSNAADPTVRLNELVAVNLNGLIDEDGEPSPWLELHNFGATAVNLAGLSLTDDQDDPGRWPLPAVTLEPGSHRVIFAGGKDRRSVRPGAELHANFSLSRRGEYLGLFNGESPRRALSELAPKYPSQRHGIAWARLPNATWAYVQPPTPGTVNGGLILTDACEPVHFSTERGFFAAPFELVLSCPTPGAVIRYTLQGSEPDLTNSLVYATPIRIERNTIVRATAFAAGQLPSELRTHTYLYSLSTAQRSLPALSLVTATNHLTGPTGIVGIRGGTRDGSGAWVRVSPTDYFNPINRGAAWERPVSVEYLSPAENGIFQVDAGLRVHASDYFRPRLTSSSKFSWRLYFRGDYGEGRLRHRLMPTSEVEEFDALVCRAGSNDLNPFVKDELQRRLYADCGQVSAQGTLVTLFLNGRYSGYYNPVERIEADFLSIRHGGSEEWDVVSQSGPLDGDRLNFDQLLSFVSGGNLASVSQFQLAEQRIDTRNFADYLLVNAYGYNGDWPGNNWRAARERRTGALWRFYIWDAEWSYGTYGRAVTGNTFSELNDGSPISVLYQRLRASPEFRLQFADRVHRHFFNGGALSETNVRRRFSELYRQLSPLLPGMERTITNTWVTSRPRSLIPQLVAAGLHASSNAPVLTPFGGTVPVGFPLSLTNQQGDLWYTLDGTDPRVPYTGTVAATARRLAPASQLILDATVTVRARSLGTNGAWSALTEATFQVGSSTPPVRISEVMYQPVGGSAYEFIELRNLANRAVSLTDWSFRGVNFRFPNGASLPARGVLVLASNDQPTLFTQRYPGVTPFGWYGGALDNQGELLELVDGAGFRVDAVRFRPDQGWPSAAAGTGRSLERRRFDSAPGDLAAWQASQLPAGSPSTGSDLPAATPPVRLAEVLAANDGFLARGTAFPDFVELLAGPTPVDLSLWTLRRTDTPERFRFPEGTRLEPGARLTVWCGGGEPGDLIAPFRLRAEGNVLVLANAADQVVDTLAYGPQAPRLALGLVGSSPDWVPVAPSPGQPNQPLPLGSPTSLRLNEWLPNASPGESDFLELFNRDTNRPVLLTGLSVTTTNQTDRLLLPTVIGPGGFTLLLANGGSEPGELGLRLSAAGDVIRLSDPLGLTLDEVRYGVTGERVTLGRLPDGATNQVSFGSGGTPGAPNLAGARPGPQFSELFLRPRPDATTPDLQQPWVELRNTDTNAVALAGWQLARSAPGSATWTFPPGLTLNPGAFLRVLADPGLIASTTAGPRMNSGLEIPWTGATLDLLDPQGALQDRLDFGPQIPGFSIGGDPFLTWDLLSTPTPGTANAAPFLTALGDGVRLNEWLASSDGLRDFVELYNPGEQPVRLTGWRVTDDPSLAGLDKFRLPALSFLGARDWLVLSADDRPDRGPTHLPFQLSSRGETLRLHAVFQTSPLDSVTLLPTVSETPTGRFPDGGPLAPLLTQPTPGTANLVVTDGDRDGLPDAWERLYQLNPNLASDAADDPDRDGASNLAEYLAGTDPRDGGSVLALRIAELGGVLTVSFTAQPGFTYTLLAGETLTEGAWQRWREFDAGPGLREVQVTEPLPEAARFFRVVTPRLP